MDQLMFATAAVIATPTSPPRLSSRLGKGVRDRLMGVSNEGGRRRPSDPPEE
jgi:hypothetical protein